MRHIAYIGIGSNIGDKAGNCEKAISGVLKIDRHQLLARSSFYRTQPVGYTSQDWFVNGVIKIETELEPLVLLRAMKALEAHMGRKETFPWGPRVIDLDLLFYDEETIRTGELEIPHARLHERQFVLIPLAEIDPSYIHPLLKRSVGDLARGLKENQGVENISSASCEKGRT